MYSYRKTIKKGIKYGLILFLGLVISGLSVKYPSIWNFSIGTSTLGSLLVMAYDYIKHRWGVKMP